MQVVPPSRIPGALVRYISGEHDVIHRPIGPHVSEEVRPELGMLGVPAIDPPFVAIVKSIVNLPSGGGVFSLNKPGLKHAIKVGGEFYNGDKVVGRSAKVQLFV